MSKRPVMFVVSLVIIAAASGTVVVGRQRTAAPLQTVGELLVGSWTGQGVYAADYPGVGKKGDKFTNTLTCRWVAGTAALACEGKSNQATWTSLLYWDAGAKQIRTVGVNAGGNFDQGTVSKQGDKLVWASAGSFADGRPVEFKYETTFQDNGNTRIEAGATILGGARSEFRDTYKKVIK